MWAVGIGLNFVLATTPNLPACSKANALPVAENSVMLDVVHLPTNQLAAPLQVPSAQAAYTAQITN